MEDIHYNEFIITCEACGGVKKFTVHDRDDTDTMFHEYQCANGCGKNMLSFIKLGLLHVDLENAAETVG